MAVFSKMLDLVGPNKWFEILVVDLYHLCYPRPALVRKAWADYLVIG
jgi:hypothetical protein